MMNQHNILFRLYNSIVLLALGFNLVPVFLSPQAVLAVSTSCGLTDAVVHKPETITVPQKGQS